MIPVNYLYLASLSVAHWLLRAPGRHAGVSMDSTPVTVTVLINFISGKTGLFCKPVTCYSNQGTCMHSHWIIVHIKLYW